MMKKLVSIGFAINIVLCSVGVQVMQHNCTWCGGDRIEFIQPDAAGDGGSCCENEKQTSPDNCTEEGCCQLKLVKLTSGMTSEEGMLISLANGRSILFEGVFLITYLKIPAYSILDKCYPDRYFNSAVSPPATFFLLRC